jgi:hypothetical protein
MVMKRRGSHIFWTIGSQMAVRLSASQPAALYPQEDFWYSFLLEAESTPGSIKKSNDLMGNRTRDLPACSIVSQPTTLPLPYLLLQFILIQTALDNVKCILVTYL